MVLGLPHLLQELRRAVDEVKPLYTIYVYASAQKQWTHIHTTHCSYTAHNCRADVEMLIAVVVTLCSLAFWSLKRWQGCRRTTEVRLALRSLATTLELCR
jgi:hypothetical protein